MRLNEASDQENVETDESVCLLVIDTVPPFSDTSQTSDEVQAWLSYNGAMPSVKCRTFSTCGLIQYVPFCDDFGPLNMASIMTFIELLDDEAEVCRENGVSSLVFLAEQGRRGLTNAVFLLGAYLLLKMDMVPADIWNIFGSLSKDLLEGYRDATYSERTFRLSLLDCWQGLYRGKTLGWVARPVAFGDPSWGSIDRDAYEHYDNALNADLHEVVPQKFIAFRGPRDLGGHEYLNNYENNFREFAPEYYIDIFKELKVSTVVRLNEVHYDEGVFTSHGIEHADLYFEDCSCPPRDVVARFFRLADEATGVIAVHCKAGLGRTGTLIALYMMRTHGFTAREAMGWLRIMRSGCVLGYQQEFLCDIEALASYWAQINEIASRPPSDPDACAGCCGPSHPCGLGSLCTNTAAYARNVEEEDRRMGGEAKQREAMAMQVSEGMMRRCSARLSA